MRFIDDLAGAIYDLLKFIIRSLCYLVAGMIIVGVPIYIVIWLFGIFID